MAEYYDPMKAKLSDVHFLESVKDDVSWAAGEKFDGYREQIHLLNTGNEMWSSGGNSHIGGVPQFHVLVPALHDTILDCEGLSPTRRIEDNATCFKCTYPDESIAWQDKNGMAFVVIFDILKYKGLITMDLPFYKRRVLLENAFSELSRHCMWNTQARLEQLVFKDKVKFYQGIIDRTKEEGHEGIILKDMGAVYKPGNRGRAWLKVKRVEPLTYLITGFINGTGKYANMIGAVCYGSKPGEQLGTASGMDDSVRQDMTDHPDKYVGKKAYFECQEITDMNVMRHPRYKGMVSQRR